MLCKVDFGHTFGVRRDSDSGSGIHRSREGGAGIGQVPGGFFNIVHVCDYTRYVYSGQQYACIDVDREYWPLLTD